jgi:Ca-activated chloride channel family protein
MKKPLVFTAFCLCAFAMALLCSCAKAPKTAQAGPPGWVTTERDFSNNSIVSEGVTHYRMAAPSPMPTGIPLQKMRGWAFSEPPDAKGVAVLKRYQFSAPPTEEEIWVIKRPSRAEKGRDEKSPGCGALMTSQNKKNIPLPLKHTSVEANVAGFVAQVSVKQEFQNPFNEKIEAVYIFPLPENAAVNEFVMIIGTRKIRGIIREREEAESIYAQAKSQGYAASLLAQERPNVFVQSVANIEPLKQIDVSITYFNTLSYADGWFEFVFPMVVGPRFNPPGSTAGIAALPRGSAPDSQQKSSATYLAPDERSGHDISLNLHVTAGMQIEEYFCPTHAVEVKPEGAGLQASLKPSDSLPNKDFVFRFRVAGQNAKPAFVSERGERGNFFALMVIPPVESSALKRAPVEMVFVLDCSGSMDGLPIQRAREAIAHALKNLDPGDTFQLINFSNDSRALGDKPLPATPENIRKGLDHLAALQAEGGTMMIKGIKAALDFPHDPERLRYVCFLTDGYIGNESEIFEAVHDRIGSSRIFSVGVGSSVNRYLLDNMARLGRGAVAYLLPSESSVEVMDSFLRRISHPCLTDVQIHWNGLKIDESYPKTLPDVFVGRPLLITGKYEGELPGSIVVSGRVGGQKAEMVIPLSKTGQGAGNALASVWARARISELSNGQTETWRKTKERQITKAALEYGLMSQYTAFIAVDASRRTDGEKGTTVPVALPVPEGVKYETTVDPKPWNNPGFERR